MNAALAAWTFVLISGAGATSFVWTPVVRELALRGHRALPIELPGHGFGPAACRARPHDREADAMAPTNPFDVHSLTTGHLAPITQPAEVADILSATRITSP